MFSHLYRKQICCTESVTRYWNWMLQKGCNLQVKEATNQSHWKVCIKLNILRFSVVSFKEHLAHLVTRFPDVAMWFSHEHKKKKQFHCGKWNLRVQKQHFFWCSLNLRFTVSWRTLAVNKSLFSPNRLRHCELSSELSNLKLSRRKFHRFVGAIA